MSAVSDYHWIQRIVEQYRDQLIAIDDAHWLATPPIGGWSCSEVYFHIFDASVLSLVQLTGSAEGSGKIKPTAFVVKLILFLGAFPPGKKFKAPKNLVERLKRVSKEEASDMMDTFLSQSELAFATLKNADPAIKTPHPKMGYLNAQHWLRFIGIHLNHHLKQLKRIEKSF